MVEIVVVVVGTVMFCAEVAALKKLIPTAKNPTMICRRKSDDLTPFLGADVKRRVDIFKWSVVPWEDQTRLPEKYEAQKLINSFKLIRKRPSQEKPSHVNG